MTKNTSEVWGKTLMSDDEKKFTSTVPKLMNYLDRLKEIKDHNRWRPITLHLAATDKCNLNCKFCSVKNRDGNELKIEDIKKAVKTLKAMGLQSVEVTGGGDPTMYSQINELLSFLHDEMKLDVGMITNGVALKDKVKKENLAKLLWLRVSLNCLDQVKDIELDVPSNVTLGFSYVWNDASNMEKIEKIKQYKNKYGARYVRVVPDCLTDESIDRTTKELKPLIENLDGFFFQNKKRGIPQECWIGYLKPFLNSDGYIYTCSTNPLFQRKFGERFRLGHMSEINKIWSNPTPFKTENCEKCFYGEQNELLSALKLKIEHGKFI